MDIPLHENLPREEFKQKNAPEMFDEIRMADASQKMKGTSSLIVGGKQKINASFNARSQDELYKLFKTRAEEF